MNYNIEPWVTLFVCGGLLTFVYGGFSAYLFVCGAVLFIMGLIMIGIACGDYVNGVDSRY